MWKNLAFGLTIVPSQCENQSPYEEGRKDQRPQDRWHAPRLISPQGHDQHAVAQ